MGIVRSTKAWWSQLQRFVGVGLVKEIPGVETWPGRGTDVGTALPAAT